MQALVSRRKYSGRDAYPAQRRIVGVDAGRAHMVCAVLDAHLGTELARADTYVNVVGGMRVSDVGIDAAVAAALLSSYWSEPVVAPGMAIAGELSLTGELRPVRSLAARVRECAKVSSISEVLIPSGTEVWWGGGLCALCLPGDGDKGGFATERLLASGGYKVAANTKGVKGSLFVSFENVWRLFRDCKRFKRPIGFIAIASGRERNISGRHH